MRRLAASNSALHNPRNKKNDIRVAKAQNARGEQAIEDKDRRRQRQRQLFQLVDSVGPFTTLHASCACKPTHR